MPTIEERPNRDGVSYRAKVRLKGFTAEDQSFPSKKEAIRWAHATEQALKSGLPVGPTVASTKTVSDLIDRYEREVIPNKPANARNLLAQLKWWRAEIGTLTLPQLTPAVIAGCREKLLASSVRRQKADAPVRHKSSATVRRYLAVLSHACTMAVQDWQWLNDNPVRNVRKPPESRGRERILTEEEREQLLQACQASKNPYLHTATVLALSTGMRRGEILALKRADVDLVKKRLLLRKTKNGDRRGVPLAGLALHLMTERVVATKGNGELLFPGGAPGKPLDISKAWRTTRKSAGLTDFRFHDLRHCAASALLDSGATLPQLAEVLGHRTLQMVKRYTHLSPGQSASIVEAMNVRMFGDGETVDDAASPALA